jgi:transposase
VSDDDVLYGYRLRLFALAGEVGVRAACRTMGVHHSTYYRWKPQVERAGLEMLRPRERRQPQMPNQLSPLVEQRIVAFALGHPGLGPKRIAAQLAWRHWGGLLVSANGVYKTLVRHGLNTRAKRLALVAGYRAPYEPPREPEPEPHIETQRPGELVGMGCFFVGRLHGAAGPVWQITAIDCHSSYAWADLVVCPPAGPTIEHTSALARRVAAELQAAGWQLERVLTDNGKRVRSPRVPQTTSRGRHADADPLRPPPNQRARRTSPPHNPRGVLATRLRSLPPGPPKRPQTPPRQLPALLQHRTRPHRPPHPRPRPRRPRLPCPQDGTEMSRTSRHNSESVQPSRVVARRQREQTPRLTPGKRRRMIGFRSQAKRGRMLTTAELLQALATSVSAVRDGPQQVAPGQPVRVHLVPPTIDLNVPAVMKGEVSLTFLTKDVRFANALGVPIFVGSDAPDLDQYISDATKVVGGQPVADVDVPLEGPPLKGAMPPFTQVNIAEVVGTGPLPQVTATNPPSPVAANPTDIGALPTLPSIAGDAANALSGVPGLIGQLVGAIPVPVMAPVELTVTWKVTRNGNDVASGPTTWELIGSGADVQFVFAQVFTELTSAGPTLAHFQVLATVTLTVGSDTVNTVLPPVLVDVPTIGIPSMAALFNTTQFGGASPGTDDDKAVMILVPSNSPISDLNSLNQHIMDATSAVNGVLSGPLVDATTAAQLALFLTGLGRFSSAVSTYVGGAAKWPARVVVGDSNDGVGDLSAVPYDDEFLAGDNFDDEVYSLILLAIPTVHLLLTTDDNYKKTSLTVTTGPEMVVGVPDFANLGNVIPTGAMGTAVGAANGGDLEDIEDGNFEAVRFVRT